MRHEKILSLREGEENASLRVPLMGEEGGGGEARGGIEFIRDGEEHVSLRVS